MEHVTDKAASARPGLSRYTKYSEVLPADSFARAAGSTWMSDEQAESRPGSAGRPPEGGGTMVSTKVNRDLDAPSSLRRDDEGTVDSHRLTGRE